MPLFYKTIPSPVGELKLIATDAALVAVSWRTSKPIRFGPSETLAENPEHPILKKTEQQLNEYFAGKRKTFSIPLDIRGTDFQKNVWEALLAIPFGETRAYLDLAKQLGNPNGTRAVGAANGRNPIPIIVPCHRVIGSSGKLVGFGGGLDRKELLLKLESTGQTLFD